MKTLSNILRNPHITEKATVASERGVYVFTVDPRATKETVAKAFIEQYKVTPVKIATVTIPAKATVVRGKRGTQAGYKKAYIYLKKGDKIEIM